jgi:hypothetical protein
MDNIKMDLGEIIRRLLTILASLRIRGEPS